MSVAVNCIISLFLAFLLLAGMGCKDQERKSKERGSDAMGNIKGAEEKARDAASKVQKNAEQLEQENK